VVATADAGAVTEDDVRRELAALTGEIDQVPSAVSAIKVGGQRSYARVRAGESVELAARRVLISRIDVLAVRRPEPGLVDADIEVDCSTGTYIRAIARDLGTALGVGGHLTALRRTRVGPFGIEGAVPLEELGENPVAVGLDTLTERTFDRIDVDADTARLVGNGVRIPAAGLAGPYGIFGPDGRAIALAEDTGGKAKYLVVLRPASS
jgi:tRNA pseudouridine55 synthase